jgi:hypothetical protein
MATRNKLAHRCHCKVYRAIRRGELEHPYYLPCEDCGSGPSEYDHEWGYRHWKRVVPRCRACHKKRHRLKNLKCKAKKTSTHVNIDAMPTGVSDSDFARLISRYGLGLRSASLESGLQSSMS